MWKVAPCLTLFGSMLFAGVFGDIRKSGSAAEDTCPGHEGSLDCFNANKVKCKNGVSSYIAGPNAVHFQGYMPDGNTNTCMYYNDHDPSCLDGAPRAINGDEFCKGVIIADAPPE